MHLIRDLSVAHRFEMVRGQVVKLWYKDSVHVGHRVLKILLGDGRGSLIEVRAYGIIADNFKDLFRQYDWYLLSKFLVVPFDEEVEIETAIPSKDCLRIYLTSTTLVEKLMMPIDFEDPYYPSEFVLMSPHFKHSEFVHLMGAVFGVGDIVGGEVKFIVGDIRGVIVHCVAKGDVAIKISKLRDGYGGDDFVVCFLRYWRVHKTSDGVFVVAEPMLSEVLEDPWLEDALKFRARMRDFIEGCMH